MCVNGLARSRTCGSIPRLLFDHRKLIVKKKIAVFSECSDPARGGACAPQEKIRGQRERANQPPLPLSCHLSLALATSVATSCFANPQTSVSICRRLKSPFSQ